MFQSRVQTPHQRPSPLKTLLGVIGIMIGIVFFLQLAGMFSFEITNPMYMKIFAVYAVLSGLVLLINVQRHGIIRY